MAVQIVREVSADVIKRGATRAIYAKQNDVNSRFMNVRIQEEGKDIKVEPTETVLLNVSRSDKQENIFYGTVNEDGTVRVPMTAWMLELEGTLVCDISIVAEGSDIAKLTTMQFNIYVEAAVVSDASIIDTEDYSVIVDLLERTERAEEQATTAAAQAEVLKTNCEAATDRANEASDELASIKEELAAGGYITGMQEQNAGSIFKVWVGTQAEYDEIPDKKDSCLYIITNDKAKEEFEELKSRVYPVRTGTEGIWTYRMWSNGDVECWATFIYNMTRVTITNNHYGYHCITSGYKFPKDLFIGMPFIDYNAGNDSGQGGLTGCGQGVVKAAKANATKENTGYLYVDFPSGLYAQADWTLVGENGTDKTYTFPEGQYLPIQVSIEAKGRWKEEE